MRPKLNTKSKPLKSIFAADTPLSVAPCSSLLWVFFMRGMSLQEVMLLTLQGGMGLSGTKSSFIKDDRVLKTVPLISLSVCMGDGWGIKSVVGERYIPDAV